MEKPVIDVSPLRKLCHTIRGHIIDAVEYGASGHPSASFSAVEIMTALYFSFLRVNPQDPKWEERDRFVLSKGHATPALYSILAEKGFFPIEELRTFRNLNSRLQGHPDIKKTPGVDMTTGSLGQGFASSVGMAIGLKRKGSKARVVSLLGDGELNEGEIWEAAMIASHYRLDNLMAIVDKNGMQASGLTNSIMNMDSLGDKWAAFGWNVLEIDGHNLLEISQALEEGDKCRDKPTVIIAHTIKGKGVPFMEAGNEFYGEKITTAQIEAAREYLRKGDFAC